MSTQLYKRNGGVFIPVNLTAEEAAQIRQERDELLQRIAKMNATLDQTMTEQEAIQECLDGRR